MVATSKIAHRPTCLLGSLMSARFNSSGYPLSKRPELFEQHATATQIKIHLSRIKQHPQTSAETNPIKAAQSMRDLLAKFVIKTFRNAVWCWCGLVSILRFYQLQRRSNTQDLWLRLRRAVISVTSCSKTVSLRALVDLLTCGFEVFYYAIQCCQRILCSGDGSSDH